VARNLVGITQRRVRQIISAKDVQMEPLSIIGKRQRINRNVRSQRTVDQVSQRFQSGAVADDERWLMLPFLRM
jgi:hypothetical protein